MDWGPNILSMLASISLRVLIVAAIARLTLFALGRRAQRTRHAIWTLVMFGMLLAVAASLFPPLSLHVLKVPATAVPVPVPVSEYPTVESAPQPLPTRARISRQRVAVSIYGLGVLF